MPNDSVDLVLPEDKRWNWSVAPSDIQESYKLYRSTNNNDNTKIQCVLNTYYGMKAVRVKKDINGKDVRETDEQGRYRVWEHTQDYLDMMWNFHKYVPANKCLIDNDDE